ncbi:MAG: ACP S-malonyltransferase [Candidatus Eiseniibacteriota bacterium]|nr:MAG: ACP S-malonyltransferase [Candidatus Eisenbacteria bacterium]
MGGELCQEYPAARHTYEEADSILGFPLSEVSFRGPEEVLRETRNTQPAIFVHSVAVFRVLSEAGLRPSLAAGHSLGEYSALTAAGALDFADALPLVRKRGELMYEAGVKRPGTMAAVLGLSSEEVETLCRDVAEVGVVQPANLNSPNQTVISGEVAAVERAVQTASERGAKRAIRLPVSGAFHSPLMQPASEELSAILAGVNIRPASFPVVANFSAAPVQGPEEIRRNLAEQVLGAVRWQESMQYMLASGVNHFIEVGPGNVLKGLLRGIDRGVNVLCAAAPPEVEDVIAFLEREGADAR